jgi:hypothetical protein
MTETIKPLISMCVVCDHGTIRPVFDLTQYGAKEFYSRTSGELKYLSSLKGKTVKVTLEVME